MYMQSPMMSVLLRRNDGHMHYHTIDPALDSSITTMYKRVFDREMAGGEAYEVYIKANDWLKYFSQYQSKL